MTVNTIHNHASIPKPEYVPQDSNVQGMYWQGDLLDGLGALGGHALPAGAIKVKVRSVAYEACADRSLMLYTC